MLQDRHIRMREGLPRFAAKLLRGEAVTAAYLGGSITEGAGASLQDEKSWRALNGKYLSERYADCRFTFINAGVGGTNSTFGAHRLQAHALSQGEVDLLFVEFSVNDGEDREESIRGMEGIVRQCRRLSPETELCFVYTAADKNLSDELPFNIANHEEVAEHYGIASLNLAGGVRDLVRASVVAWAELAPDRVHPNDEGHALYAAYAEQFIEQAVAAVANAVKEEETSTSPVPSEIPNASVVPAPMIRGDVPVGELPRPLDARNYEFATMKDIGLDVVSDGFAPARLGPDDPMMNWRFATEHLAAEGSRGESLSFALEGRRIGILLLHGPDSGALEYSLDGGKNFTPVDPFDEWCLLAYRPIQVSFQEQPERQLQQVIVRCAGTKDERSKGTGIRVMKLLSS
ncbi:SGNH/GDSL hydrolase family protein [Paenibacillus sacheonensis]|uniref:SGNH hydrolase-type esterase domain-containing protein n=1 Tax=Paenibacillus sacheonensis TaxID=742054 RepID=A0A7X5BZS4_9BACL|nr:SGNH/GDSL hydrolase family protein [Paenibacillus sacheonensis]MBM7567057.1 lysophospholipase L1-like esterase [Paenibacillus sacheonensis]NBC71012.1 hypothetical protein [Paenibacillus sacheonensis]